MYRPKPTILRVSTLNLGSRIGCDFEGLMQPRELRHPVWLLFQLCGWAKWTLRPVFFYEWSHILPQSYQNSDPYRTNNRPITPDTTPLRLGSPTSLSEIVCSVRRYRTSFWTFFESKIVFFFEGNIDAQKVQKCSECSKNSWFLNDFFAENWAEDKMHPEAPVSKNPVP